MRSHTQHNTTHTHIHTHTVTHVLMRVSGALLAPVLLSRCATPLGVESSGGPSSPSAEGGEAGPAHGQDVAATLLAAAEAFGLQDCWQWKPLVDGKQVGDSWACVCVCRGE